MERIRAHPDLQGLRRWMLVTRDAHDVYRQFGFGPVDNPASIMQIRERDVYRRTGDTSAHEHKRT
jgi:hypothetical protein